MPPDFRKLCLAGIIGDDFSAQTTRMTICK